MKKLFTLLAVLLAATFAVNAGTVKTAPDSVVLVTKPNQGSIKIYNGTTLVTKYKFATKAELELTLIATPNSGYIFHKWGGDVPEDFNDTTTIILSTQGIIAVMNGDSIEGYKDTLTIEAFFRDGSLCNKTLDFLANSTWSLNVDEFKSTITKNTGTDPSFTYNVQPYSEKNNIWPWVDASDELMVAPYIDSKDWNKNGDTTDEIQRVNFKGLQAIQITYTSTDPLSVTLPMNGDTVLAPQGWSHVYPKIAAAPDAPNSVTLYLDEFKVADYAPVQHLNDPLILDSCTSISFQPVMTNNLDNGGSAASGTMTIKSIKLCGLDQLQGINNYKVQAAGIFIKGFYNNALNISSSENGMYRVDIYTVDGKAAYSSNTDIHTGLNTIQVSNPLSSGIYMIHVSNENGSLTKKVFIK